MYAMAYNNRATAYFFNIEYEKSMNDVQKAQELGYKVNPALIKALLEASGR